jgi:hypothetical protein
MCFIVIGYLLFHAALVTPALALLYKPASILFTENFTSMVIINRYMCNIVLQNK